jgi:hypothetical protein
VRIGYEGYSSLNDGIADRRRIIFWSNSRGHQIVSSRDENADIIVISSSADLHYWSKFDTQKPLFLDSVDGLLGESSRCRDLVRGYGRWFTSSTQGSTFGSFSKLILSVAKKCQGVICSSPEQVKVWGEYGVKATAILDIHEEIPFLSSEKKLPPNEKRVLFWEGLPATLGSLYLLSELFNRNKTSNFEINVLTQLNSYKYMNKYLRVNVSKMVSAQLDFSNVQSNVFKWDKNNLLLSARSSHLGVIPVDAMLGYNTLKAENRLLIMWRMGLPVLTSPLASYVRVMSAAGIPGICSSKSDWAELGAKLLRSPEMRLEFAEKGKAYLATYHALEDILEKWDVALGKSQ